MNRLAEDVVIVQSHVRHRAAPFRQEWHWLYVKSRGFANGYAQPRSKEKVENLLSTPFLYQIVEGTDELTHRLLVKGKPLPRGVAWDVEEGMKFELLRMKYVFGVELVERDDSTTWASRWRWPGTFQFPTQFLLAHGLEGTTEFFCE